MKAAVIAAVTVWLVAASIPSTLAVRYIVHSGPVTFFEAWDQCMQSGGKLASIQTPKQNADVWAAVMRSTISSPEYWISGTQNGMPGSWIWLSLNKPVGTVGGYTNWAKGEPNNNENVAENCMSIGISGLPQWNDRLCTDPFPYVCEY